MNWILLIFAGLFEVGFTTCLKLSDGFSRWLPSVGFMVFAILSFGLLNKVIKVIPLGTAYTVWTGIGAVGTVLVGIIFFKESVDFWRVFFILLLVGSVVGLKMISVE